MKLNKRTLIPLSYRHCYTAQAVILKSESLCHSNTAALLHKNIVSFTPSFDWNCCNLYADEENTNFVSHLSKFVPSENIVDN